MITRILNRLTYANVVASIALFIALGGTGYAALSLPRDSVGARQLRPGAVGHGELARNAVRTDNVRDGSLTLSDLSSDARSHLTGERGPFGPQGPAGIAGAKGEQGAPGKDAVSLWAIVNSYGYLRGGVATTSDRVATGEYTVGFSRSVAGCAFSATLAVVQGNLTDPSPGHITVAEDGDGVRVKTYGLTGAAENDGFHLIVVC